MTEILTREVVPEREAVRRRPVEVEIHAQGLNYPTHMEWTLDGRLLVSERNGGRVLDITAGGDMRYAKPVAEGLEGPAAILPLEDRILVVENWAGRVTDIAHPRQESFAVDLVFPYGLTALPLPDGGYRIFVSEYLSLMRGQLTDITEGGRRDEFVAHVTDVPYPSPIGYRRPGFEISDPRPELMMGCEAAPWPGVVIEPPSARATLVVEANNVIFRVPPEGGSFYGIIADPKNVIASGLRMTGGMIQNTHDSRLYAVNPEGGYVFAVDLDQQGDYRHEPPVVTGLNWPSCVRFGPSGDDMYVCSFGSGVVYRVREFG